MSGLLQYAATVSEFRALFGGDQVTLGMTVVKVSMTTFFPTFCICCRHQFYKQLGALGVDCFSWLFFLVIRTKDSTREIFIAKIFFPVVISIIGIREEIISCQTHREFVHLYTVKFVTIYTKVKLRNFFFCRGRKERHCSLQPE